MKKKLDPGKEGFVTWETFLHYAAKLRPRVEREGGFVRGCSHSQEDANRKKRRWQRRRKNRLLLQL